MDTIKEIIKNKCAKQTTIAILVNEGRYFIGTNECSNPQKECPRIGMKTGEGYDLCKDVCEQAYHAEEAAIRKAGDLARGATLFLIGHYYMCNDCTSIVKKAGVAEVVILDDLICKERKK